MANKGQVSLPFPPDVSDAQRMPVVHLDANCHPGRASGVSIVVDAMTRIVASKLKAEPHRNGIEVRMLERKPAP
ncbi:MAG: hypothetical protein WCD39_05655, partial [Methyloceanibacter sp.]